MSDEDMTQDERIEFLANRVSDLETICGLIGDRLTRSDASNLERKHLVRDILGAAQAQYGKKSPLIDDSAFRNVADFIIGKEAT